MMPSRKIRVMHVINFLYDGGTETYIHTLVSRMDSQRYDFSICCLVEAGFGAERFIAEGVKVHVLSVKREAGIAAKLHNLIQMLRLARLMRQHSIDIVHSHDNFPATYARLAALLAAVPIVYVTYHNLYYWLTPLTHRLNQLLAHLTTKIVAVSRAARDYSMAKDRISIEKYRVIYNGVDCRSRHDRALLKQRYRKLFNIAEDAVVIGNVASLSQRKAQALLVKALASIVDTHPRACLVIIGSEREEEPQVRQQLESLAHELGVADRLIFTGSRNDVLEMLYMFDLFVLPSETEGFGYALVEAMCAGVPAIASDIPALAEVAGEGQHALLFETGNDRDLANKLAYALNHPAETQAMATAARHSAERIFSIENMLSGYEAMYEEDVQQQRTRRIIPRHSKP